MALFQRNARKLSPVNERKIDLEKDIQSLAEENLKAIFGLEFIATEFEYNNLRLDTLAFDNETRAFVVIEYKRDRSFSVIDQGYAYLALLLNNKAEFILKYNESTGKSLTKADVDWSQSRVIFVAHSFTIHQQQATNFRDLPIELWEVSIYENDTVLFNQLKASDSSESIKTVTKNSTIQKVSDEVKVFNTGDHFSGSKAANRELYDSLKDRLMNLDPRLKENPRASYIGYALGENGLNTLVYVHSKASGLWLDIPGVYPKDLSDPSKKLHYKERSLETYNTPLSTMQVQTEDDVDYAVSILRQTLERRFSKL